MNDQLQALHDAFSLTGVRVSPPLGMEINQLDERAAMGLPDACVDLDPARVRAEIPRLGGASPTMLAQQAEDPDQPFYARYAAGLMLGLVGDPRIDTLNPPMCDVPGGQYTLGLDDAHVDAVTAEFAGYGVLLEWIAKESPTYTKHLVGLRIGKYPVTHLEYFEFLRDTGDPRIPSAWPFGTLPPGIANQPVHTVSPADADAYAAWLSRRTGRRFRLPTEAEWEAAAGGASRREYPWGDTFLADRANTVESGILAATPVGIFPLGASPFGCLDMAGNVEEYVADDYHAYGDGRYVYDDLHPETGTYRVARGGSFTRYRDLARCKRRHGWYLKPMYVMGFRLAEDVGMGQAT